jgi:ABC-type phosphate/phosphonate transport system substrate-binding protein
VAQQSASGSKTNPSEKIAALQPVQSSAADKSVTRAGATDAHSAGGGAADANVRTVQELVAAATVVAEKVTASRSDPEQKPKAGSERNTDSGKSGVTDPLLAIIIARPDIKSIDNLRGKIVAIDAKHSASNGNLRTAIAAAGAAEVQLSDSQTKAIDRVVSGEVAAAVVTLVSPEAADWFPEIAGFKTFRIPIGP